MRRLLGIREKRERVQSVPLTSHRAGRVERNPPQPHPTSERTPEKPSPVEMRSEAAFDERKRLLFC